MMTKDQALEILHKHMQNQNLRRHCYAVGKVLAAFHDYYSSLEARPQIIPEKFADMGGLTKDEWELVGILHDADWEITAQDQEKHTLMLIDWLKPYALQEELINVFRSHNNKVTHLREPQTLLEWTLECVDELTGFIVAVALVMPNKKLADVSVASVIKKFGQKEFAKPVNRDQITQCQDILGIPVDRFIEITLTTMQENSELLAL